MSSNIPEARELLGWALAYLKNNHTKIQYSNGKTTVETPCVVMAMQKINEALKLMHRDMSEYYEAKQWQEFMDQLEKEFEDAE